MRQMLAISVAGWATLLLAGQASASDVEVKGPHICCGSCINAVNKILAKVDGVSDVKADAKTKSVTFTASSSAAAKAGFDALLAGGFYGKATVDGKEMKLDAAYSADAKKKAGSVTVTKVHACCGMCHSAIKKVFEGSKVTIEGSGPQRTITVEGDNLSFMDVVEALRKTGFNGLAK